MQMVHDGPQDEQTCEVCAERIGRMVRFDSRIFGCTNPEGCRCFIRESKVVDEAVMVDVTAMGDTEPKFILGGIDD